MSNHRFPLFLDGLCAVWLSVASCAIAGDSRTAPGPRGGERQACNADGSCNDGLVCLSELCATPAPCTGNDCTSDPCAGVSCSGHGTCDAGTCVCDSCYAGSACATCASACTPSGDSCVQPNTSCAAENVRCVAPNPGASQEYRSIQTALDAAQPGDTVLVFPGTYSGNLYLATSGQPTAPITLRANGPGVVLESTSGDPTLYVDGFPNDPTFDNESDANGQVGYIVVDGFRIEDSGGYGIRVSWAHHVTVENCTVVRSLDVGIFCDFADRFTAEGNDVSESGRPASGCSGGLQKHGFYASNSGNYPTFRNNKSHGNCGNGIHMNGDGSMGYDGDGVIDFALVEQNEITDNNLGGSGAGLSLDGGRDALVWNNLFVDNHSAGIAIYQIDGGATSTGNVVVNNTIVSATDGSSPVAIRDAATGSTLLNNILLSRNPDAPAITIATDSRTGLVSDYNLVSGFLTADDGDSSLTLSEWQALGYDADSAVADLAALFVGGSDFHLRLGSAAIDAGTLTQAPTIDLEGRPRPNGEGVDIGAYEY